MLEFSQLRCFVAVADELHFGRAAERLHMTQPPLSRQIQLLEREIGVSLLDRTSRSVRLTQAGRTFLPEARRILRIAETATLSAKRVARGEGGSVTLGFTAGTGYSFLPSLVKIAQAELPEIDLVLKEMPTTDQMEALHANRIDVGLIRLPVDRRSVEIVCVQQEPLILAVPTDHPLTEKPNLTMRDLDQQPLIMYAPTDNRYFYDLVVDALRLVEVMPVFVQFVSQAHTMLGLVSAGMGLALIPTGARRLLMPDIVYRDFTRPAPRIAELHMVWRRSNDNPAFRVFRDLVMRRPVA